MHSLTVLYGTEIEGCRCSNFQQGHPCVKLVERKSMLFAFVRRVLLLWKHKETADVGFFLETFWFFVFSKNDTKRYQTIRSKNDTERYRWKRYQTIPNDTVLYRFSEVSKRYAFCEISKTIPISTRNDTVISEKRYRFRHETIRSFLKNDTPVSIGVVFSKVTIWDPGRNHCWGKRVDHGPFEGWWPLDDASCGSSL